MDINRPIYWVLVIGVIISAIFFVGSFLMAVFLPAQANLSLSLAFVGAGVLIATPYVRMVVAIGAFSINKEYKFTILSIIVLAIMVVSFLFGVFFHISQKG